VPILLACANARTLNSDETMVLPVLVATYPMTGTDAAWLELQQVQKLRATKQNIKGLFLLIADGRIFCVDLNEVLLDAAQCSATSVFRQGIIRRNGAKWLCVELAKTSNTSDTWLGKFEVTGSVLEEAICRRLLEMWRTNIHNVRWGVVRRCLFA
jgi:hypothetical protein